MSTPPDPTHAPVRGAPGSGGPGYVGDFEPAPRRAGSGDRAMPSAPGPTTPPGTPPGVPPPTPPSSVAPAAPPPGSPVGTGEAGVAAPAEDEAQARRRRRVRSAVEWLAVIVGALVVALLIKTFLLQAFYIPSASMEPTLAIGDRVLVNKLSYRLHDVNRGDIVVFERPEAQTGSEIRDLIKRVVALPGETVSTRDGQVLIDGRVLEEPYLPPGTTTTGLEEPVTVPEGHVFVMGDNRDDSRDSRFFGPIEEATVVGRAFVRVWPLSHLGWL